jgi:hypothetical protein
VRRAPGRRLALAACAVSAAVVAGAAGTEVQPAPFPGVLDEHPAIAYARTPATDPVAVLNRALTAGTHRLTRADRTGYLPAVLEALGVAPESQLLVFSKTGVQRSHTGPRSPRALYFNETVAVGYIAGASAIEVAAHDRLQGVVFYTLEQRPSAAPSFTRQTSCLTCHVSSSTLDVPGFLVRSHVVDGEGALVPRQPVVAVNHATPHPERWGGWFVTTAAAPPPYQPMGHLGNLTASPHPHGGPPILSNHALVAWLDTDVRAAGYLSTASDHAALLVFDHQTYAANLLTRLGWEARVAAAAGALTLNAELGARVDGLVDYLLFVGEAESAVEVTPRPGFAARLRARVPADSRGRSLAEIAIVPRSAPATDLAPPARLFTYPCSFMIYAPAFDGLAAPVKEAVYRRLFAVLAGEVTGPRYAHLTPALRQAVREILLDTKTDLPPGLRTAAVARQ